MKFCKDCKWYRIINGVCLCFRKDYGRSLVTGELEYESCSVDRNIKHEDYCGREAKFFEAREAKVSGEISTYSKKALLDGIESLKKS